MEIEPLKSVFYPILVGPLVFGGLVILSIALRPVIEAAWFGYGQPGYPAGHWIALGVSCWAAYGLLRLNKVLVGKRTKKGLTQWIQGYLAFLALLYWVLALHAILVVEVSWNGGSLDVGEVSFPALEILLVSTTGAIVWLLVFRGNSRLRDAWGLFAVSAAVLVVSFVIREPYSIRYLLITTGILEPARSWVSGASSFSRDLAYLAPFGPLLWAFLAEWRRAPDWQTGSPGADPGDRM